MKTIAVITADFEQGALGTRSRLRDELAGETILRRTCRQVLKSKRIASLHLAVDTSQAAVAEQAIAGLDVKLETHHAGNVPWQNYVRSARKWSMDAWRGGLGSTCIFDESIHPWLLEALAKREQADAAVDVPAAAPLLDPRFLDAMIEHYEGTSEDVRMAFTQSAPGLSVALYATSLLGDLVKAGQSPGRMMAYNPATPQRDMIMLPCFYAPETDVRRAVGRCVADTSPAIEAITACLRECPPADGDVIPDVGTISRWLLARRCTHVPALPAEVEIELTTDDSLPDTTLRPRGQIVGRRGPMDLALFDRLVTELAGRDDIRVVLGGFGDPLLHPQWAACVRRCREAGILATAVRTPAVTLDKAAIEVLEENKVDVLNVLVDAAKPETYRKVHNADHYDRVLANLDAMLASHNAKRQPQPLLVCEMIKTHATMEELEPFYDKWVSKVGSAVIVGPSDYAGQWNNLAVMDSAPPTRFPCERIFTRAMVLADGRVTVCDQDFRGDHAIGSIADTPLSTLWTGATMTTVRRSHQTGSCDAMPLCPNCREWHRP